MLIGIFSDSNIFLYIHELEDQNKKCLFQYKISVDSNFTLTSSVWLMCVSLLHIVMCWKVIVYDNFIYDNSCENCSYFTLKWFQLNFFGEICFLTGGNWQKWKRVFLTCPCHKIYRDEAGGLKSCKNTWKITIFVKMWNLRQYRENLIFCQ